MKLEDKTQNANGNTSTKYPKFKAIGDQVQGKFISFEESVKGKFGLEDQLILDTENGEVMINCPAHLARLIKSNLSEFSAGRSVLTIKYEKDKDIGKASPMKMFDVDVTEEPDF